MVKIKIAKKSYTIPKEMLLLEALEYIKQHQDRSLTYRHMCRSSVCGSCAVKVNSKEVLACEYRLKEGDEVEPLSVVGVIRDLVTSKKEALESLKRASAYPLKMEEVEVTQDDITLIETQSDCILCTSCYSSCPVFEEKKEFLGPFALSRTYRYLADKREQEKKTHLEKVIKNGIWDCTLCGNCTEVCPQGIDPKGDILFLQSWAGRFGFINPSLGSFGSFGLEF